MDDTTTYYDFDNNECLYDQDNDRIYYDRGGLNVYKSLNNVYYYRIESEIHGSNVSKMYDINGRECILNDGHIYYMDNIGYLYRKMNTVPETYKDNKSRDCFYDNANDQVYYVDPTYGIYTRTIESQYISGEEEDTTVFNIKYLKYKKKYLILKNKILKK
jgi:hypothetical protein